MNEKEKPQAPELTSDSNASDAESFSGIQERIEVTVETDKKLTALAQEVEQDFPEVTKYETLMS